MTYLINEKKYSIFLIAIVGSIAILSIPLILNQVLKNLEINYILNISIISSIFLISSIYFYITKKDV